MLSKEEAKELKLSFWTGFRRYCGSKHINRRWVLTGVKIRNTQLKFFVDREKAYAMFQIDHKTKEHRYEVFDCFATYRKLLAGMCGEDLLWERDFEMDERLVSAVYFRLDGVNIYRKEDWEKIYDFFIEKMILLEDAYWELREAIEEQLKGTLNA